jgi:hypothetical protein
MLDHRLATKQKPSEWSGCFGDVNPDVLQSISSNVHEQSVASLLPFGIYLSVQTYVAHSTSWGISSLRLAAFGVFVILRGDNEACTSNLSKNGVIEDSSVVYGLCDMNCVKCNALHIVSRM